MQFGWTDFFDTNIHNEKPAVLISAEFENCTFSNVSFIGAASATAHRDIIVYIR